MRATGRLCAPLCALLALLPASAAQAKIRPLPKPAGIAAKPGAVRGTALIAPVSKPAKHARLAAVHPHLARTARTTPHRTVRARRRGFVPASSHGGRERAWRVLSSGGRVTAAVAVLLPTPLGIVGSGEALPVYSTDWQAWKIGVLTLFALAEAIVLTGLVRGARLERAGEFI
jgi:hypothetical protein